MNIIEDLNRHFRSITKTNPSLANDDSLRKMLYLMSKKFSKHWTARCRNREQVLNQLDIMFSEFFFNIIKSEFGSIYDLCKHGKWHEIQNGNQAGKSRIGLSTHNYILAEITGHVKGGCLRIYKVLYGLTV